jgi:3'(2'), 5'-bisphosphate nucleotidase
MKCGHNVVSPDDIRLLDDLTTLVSKAAAAILKSNRRAPRMRLKPDGSPITAADEAAHAVIADGLAQLLPDVAVVSEEGDKQPEGFRPDTPFFLVDPLDGTREYLAGRDEFTVNIALVRRGDPAVGCIAAPAFGLIWRGLVGGHAERLAIPPRTDAAACRGKIRIRARKAPQDTIVVVSRSHLDPQTQRFLELIPKAKRIDCGSSLKFCRLAEGSVDLYPRLAPTHEWDVAAGHAIVAAAGGVVVTPEGTPLTYGRITENFRVPAFLACGDPTVATRCARLAQQLDRNHGGTKTQ